MGKYERQPVDAASLQDGDVFELPGKPDTVCKVSYANILVEEKRKVHVIGYTIVEGPLHWPVIYLPLDFQVVLLLPTTTHVQLPGKEWVNSLVEHHGVSN